MFVEQVAAPGEIDSQERRDLRERRKAAGIDIRPDLHGVHALLGQPPQEIRCERIIQLDDTGDGIVILEHFLLRAS